MHMVNIVLGKAISIAKQLCLLNLPILPVINLFLLSSHYKTVDFTNKIFAIEAENITF